MTTPPAFPAMTSPPPAPVAGDLVAHAPFVRAPLSVRRALSVVWLAALPCVAMALYNTGYQVEAALSGAPLPDGWRAALLRTLGFGSSPAGATARVLLGALWFAPLLLAVALAGLAAERGFARARGRRPDHVALPGFALLLALSLPATLSPLQAAAAAVVGVVLGKEIFGGLGHSFLSPVVVALAFLTFAQPGALRGDDVWVPLPGHLAPDLLALALRSGADGLAAAGVGFRDAALGRVPGAMGQTSAAACALGLLVLLAGGVASWRIVAGGVLGLALGVQALKQLGVEGPLAELPWHWHLVIGSFAFGLVFLATDPTASATTHPGRWLHGLLFGSFVALVRLANSAYEEGVVLALLLASVSAPLLDRLVASAMLRWNRVARHG